MIPASSVNVDMKKMNMKTVLVIVATLLPLSQAFVPKAVTATIPPNDIRLQQSAAQRLYCVGRDSSFGAMAKSSLTLPLQTLAFACTLALSPFAAGAVSGGGLDFAGTDISGQDFSGGNYKGKDFTQVIAKATNFGGSNLQGCRFYKAYLVRTDFTGADLRGAALEDTSMDEALFKNTVAQGAYFSASIIDAKDLENADFTDAQFPSKTLSLLCERADVKGTNPTTGADTRESLMCP